MTNTENKIQSTRAQKEPAYIVVPDGDEVSEAAQRLLADLLNLKAAERKREIRKA